MRFVDATAPDFIVLHPGYSSEYLWFGSIYDSQKVGSLDVAQRNPGCER